MPLSNAKYPQDFSLKLIKSSQKNNFSISSFHCFNWDLSLESEHLLTSDANIKTINAAGIELYCEIHRARRRNDVKSNSVILYTVDLSHRQSVIAQQLEHMELALYD